MIDLTERLSRREFIKKLVLTLMLPDTMEQLARTPVVYRQLPQIYEEQDIALTVDDCWVGRHLEKILNEVEEKKVPLTIFPVGRVFTGELLRKQLQRAAKLGCFFGNHTYSHPILTKLNENDIKEEVLQGRQALVDNLPQSQILPILRPPGGSYNLQVARVLGLTDLRGIVFWGPSSGGTGYSGGIGGEQEIMASLKEQITGQGKRGIVLLHAISNDANNFAALVDYLRSSKYNLVSLEKLAS